MRRFLFVFVSLVALQTRFAWSQNERGSADRPTPHGANKPVKVFVLAGQSNMVGHAFIKADPRRNNGLGSLESLAQDSAAAEKFKRLRNKDGAWTVRDDVWIHFLERRGKLTVGYGAGPDTFGPELGFGQVVGDAYDEPVLLIKLAWGGKSLAVDFRPPSSGGDVGPYYKDIVQRTKDVLENLKREFPELADRGYELAGFGWHQGWNDRVNQTYNDQYEKNLANFIRDVRKDLGAKDLPFVIAETGMGGTAEKHPRALSLMKAQAAVAEYKEFQGNVAFVGTREFWREPDISPSNQNYHWNSNAETYYLIGEAMGEAMKKLAVPPARPAGEVKAAQTNVGQAKAGEMAGYLLVPHSRVDNDYDAGFSVYVAAWPLLKEYPGNRFQTGLLGTWMFARTEKPLEGKHYSDIEGGLGWWRDTRFATTTPKFIMGGVALNFSEWANGPGAGKGRNWDKPSGKYGIAQLSPWILWPPDGLNLKQGTSGELFGYGYLPLPLTPAKTTTAGKDIPTGDQSWTLFLNTGNFKGPVAFFTPYHWSKPTLDNPQYAGQFLDARPSNPNKAVQMETQYIPCFIGTDAGGKTFARIAPTSFPRDEQGRSAVIHRITAYRKGALWDGVKSWFEGGEAASGVIDEKHAALHKFSDKGGSTWRMHDFNTPDGQRTPIDWNAFAAPTAIDDHTYGYKWDADKTTPNGSLTTLPEHYRLEKTKQGKDQWQAVSAADVPAEIGLGTVSFGRPRDARPPEPYVTPDDAASDWKSPGPKAGPFTAKLGDGSVVTYSWYRFADQPAILNADLTNAERESLQKRVELIHRGWKKDQEYLPPNTVGTLADIDPALIVTPPQGLEIGYVPIVTRQAAE
ncbi:MAG: sialate O-acetylesterase [Pirellulales bacterium]